jgi:uncharacterized Fe-S center protein
MPSTVYFGSAHQARLEESETLTGKLDLILERLHLRERVKDEFVIIKMHVGNKTGYATLHPVFVRKVVQAVKDGGGQPFIVDLDWNVRSAATRGYTAEVLGCPVYPISGIKEKYFYPHQRAYKNMQEWKVAGMAQDATFLVNFAHVKGHTSTGYGGAFKNLALGCMAAETRSAMHDLFHYDPYWFSDKCPDPAVRHRIIDACPFGALVEDKENPAELHLHMDNCNQCGRCLQAAPPGSLKIDPVNFDAFQEACAISTAIVLSTFDAAKTVHLNLATFMTPLCDCWGFTTLPILPDVGVFGSDDIVALDQATLDVIAREKLIEENIPTSLEVHTRKGHPLQQLHGPLKDPYAVVAYGEREGLGSRQYELVDVLPVEDMHPAPRGDIPADGGSLQIS